MRTETDCLKETSWRGGARLLGAEEHGWTASLHSFTLHYPGRRFLLQQMLSAGTAEAPDDAGDGSMYGEESAWKMKIVDVNRVSKGVKAGSMMRYSALIVVGNANVSARWPDLRDGRRILCHVQMLDVCFAMMHHLLRAALPPSGSRTTRFFCQNPRHWESKMLQSLSRPSS